MSPQIRAVLRTVRLAIRHIAMCVAVLTTLGELILFHAQSTLRSASRLEALAAKECWGLGAFPTVKLAGGAGGIRTLDTAFQPYNGLANRRLQPLGHSSNPNFEVTLTFSARSF